MTLTDFSKFFYDIFKLFFKYEKQYFCLQTCRMHQDFFFQNILRAFFEVEKIDKIAFFGFWVEILYQIYVDYLEIFGVLCNFKVCSIFP